MTMTRPRWLAFLLLPVFAIALDRFHDRILSDLIDLAQSGHSFQGLLASAFAMFIGPLLTIALFAYPMARVYGRHVPVASLLACVPELSYTLEAAKGGNVLLIAPDAWLAVLLLVASWACHLRLRATTLAIVPMGEAGATAARSPRWLMLSLLPLVAMALYYLYLQMDILLRDPINAVVPDFKPVRQFGWMTASLLSAVMTAALLAYPIGRVYARRAALVAVAVTLPASIAWSLDALRELHRLHAPWSAATYFTTALALLTLVPLAAWWMHRRLTGSRLVVVEARQDDAVPPAEAT